MTDATTGGTPRLTGTGLTLGYDRRVIAEDLDVAVPDGSFTVIVGPNACGKSTLLRALARILRPTAGTVVLDGGPIASWPAKKLARTLGLLPQSPIAPEGITVADLVSRGRYPHQSLLRQWSREDERVVAESMEATGVADLAGRHVDELSGGQRQRVAIARAVVGPRKLILADEPTGALDSTTGEDVLRLLRARVDAGAGGLLVTHEARHAAWADRTIFLRDGVVIDSTGEPAAVESLLINADGQ